ncbi:DUF362 domain-containing protein [Archangium gephyra]|uniref:DUF362 domain-containing protein n=1 Tax=Archangium gephyra TaxID=48 RepID=UPI0035D4A389
MTKGEQAPRTETVAGEFQRKLDAWAERFRGRPTEELRALLLLALERERIVAVAYRDEVMRERLASVTMPEESRALMRQALAWAWRDEEMHATYTRGVLLRIGSVRVRVATWFSHVAGALAGWAIAVRHHTSFARAPISTLIATSVMLLGRLGGKVPRPMRHQLRRLTLREYCALQVDAEESASLGWRRIAQVAAQVPGLPPDAGTWFSRMHSDEDKHARIFRALMETLGEGDAVLAPTGSLVSEVGRADELFLPRALRSDPLRSHPVGQGGRVVVHVSPAGESKQDALRRAVEDAGLVEVVRARAEAVGRPISSLRVLLRVSFMLGYHRDDRSNITDPELVEALALRLRELGIEDIAVADAGNLYDRFFDGRSVHEVARYFGFTSPAYRIVDLEAEQVPHAYSRGMAQSTIARSWRDAELRIVFSKARSHPVDLAHLSIATIQGVGARFDEFLFAERFASRETALLMPLLDFPPHFALVDAFEHAADGLVGILGCRRPPAPRRLYAGADALAVDLLATRHLGAGEPLQSPLLRLACDWFGDPRGATRLVGTDEAIPGFRAPYEMELHALMGLLSIPVWQFASGRGAAFLPDMDTRAFPPRAGRGQGPFWRLYRALMRALVGP